jgi:hypothetical protein
MLYTEAAVSLAGLVAFLLFVAGVRRWWPTGWPDRVDSALPVPAPIE